MSRKNFFYDDKSEYITSNSSILSQYKKGISSLHKNEIMKTIYKNKYQDSNCSTDRYNPPNLYKNQFIPSHKLNQTDIITPQQISAYFKDSSNKQKTSESKTNYKNNNLFSFTSQLKVKSKSFFKKKNVKPNLIKSYDDIKVITPEEKYKENIYQNVSNTTAFESNKDTKINIESKINQINKLKQIIKNQKIEIANIEQFNKLGDDKVTDLMTSLINIKQNILNNNKKKKSKKTENILKYKKKLDKVNKKYERNQALLTELTNENNKLVERQKIIEKMKKLLIDYKKKYEDLSNKISNKQNMIINKDNLINNIQNIKNNIITNNSIQKHNYYQILINDELQKNNLLIKAIQGLKEKSSNIQNQNILLKNKYESEIRNINQKMLELSLTDKKDLLTVSEKEILNDNLSSYYIEQTNLLKDNQKLKQNLIIKKILEEKCTNFQNEINELQKNCENINELYLEEIEDESSDESKLNRSFEKTNIIFSTELNTNNNNYKKNLSPFNVVRNCRKTTLKNSMIFKNYYKDLTKLKSRKPYIYTITSKGVLLGFDILNKKYTITNINTINNWKGFIVDYLNYFTGSLLLNTLRGFLILTSQFYNNLFYYSQKKNTIVKLQKTKYGHKYGSMVFSNDHKNLYIGGGENCKFVEKLNFENNKCIKTQLPNLLCERINFCFGIINNKLFALFGQQNNTIEYLDLENIDKWILINYSTNIEKNIDIEGHACIPANNELLITGGSKNSKMIIFNTEKNYLEVTNNDLPLIESVGEYMFDKDKNFNHFNENQLYGMDSMGNIHIFENDFSYIVLLIKNISE